MSEWKFVTNIFQYSNIFVTLWIKTPYHICKVRVWVRSVRFFYSQCWKLIWLIGAFSRSQLSNFRSFSINPDDLDHPIHPAHSYLEQREKWMGVVRGIQYTSFPEIPEPCIIPEPCAIPEPWLNWDNFQSSQVTWITSFIQIVHIRNKKWNVNKVVLPFQKYRNCINLDNFQSTSC